jgi:hypothetical protein
MNRRSLLASGGGLVVAGVGASYLAVRNMGSMEEYNAAVAAARAALRQTPEIRDFIRYATLAPSGHNTQPWKFRPGEGGVDILPDFSRRTPVVDPDDHHLFVGLGCSAETLAIAAGARGRPCEVAFDPANGGSVGVTFGNGDTSDIDLCDAIPKRQSTRSVYDGRAASATELQLLAKAAAIPGVDLVLITDRAQIDRVRDLVVAGNSAQMDDAAFVRELKYWLRFSPLQALATGDGLFSASSGLPTLPAWLGPHVFDWVVTAKSENETYARQLASSSGIAVFVSQVEDKAHWVLAGRACQRFALQATALGIKHAFVNQPIEVPSLRPELASLLGLPGRRPDLVMRFGYGPALPYSARRPVGSSVIA